jgi:hypothetical protein
MAIPVETLYQRCRGVLLSYEVASCSGAVREAKGDNTAQLAIA